MKKPKSKTISKTQVEKLLAKFTPEHQQRLRELFALWKNPSGSKTLPQWQVRELRQAGLIQDGTTGTTGTLPDALPAYASGSKLAEILTREFGSRVSPVMISRSLRNDGMIGKAANGLWKVSDSVAWWAANRVVRGGEFAALQAESDIAEMKRKIDDARRSRIMADDAEKEHDAKWSLTSEAIAGALGAVQKLRGFFRTAADRKFGIATVTELRTRGFTEEQLAVVGEVCSQVGRDIVREVEGEAARFSEAQTPVQ